MLVIAGAAQYMSAPGQSYSVAAFKDPMRDSLALSDTDYSLAYAFATVLSACLLPYVGRLLDRFGARVMLPAIAAGLGLACIVMSRTTSLVGLYLGFGCVRSLGQGALSLVAIWMVGEWFERKRGLATAFAGIGGALSVMTVPLINGWLIESYGWQTAWTVLAVAVWVSLLVPGILFVTNRPEDIGLHPDNIDPADIEQMEESDGPSITSFEDSWTVKQVLRDRTFWKLLSVPATSALVVTGLVFHQVKLLEQHGLTSRWALGMLSIQATIALALTFPAGWATDNWPSRYILSASMIVLAVAIVLALVMPAPWVAVVYAFCLGVQGSVMRSTGSVVWINYYGRAHQGAVRSVAWSVMILGSAIGPLPLAFSIDQFGSYRPALLFFLALPIAAAIAVWTAYPPGEKNLKTC